MRVEVNCSLPEPLCQESVMVADRNGHRKVHKEYLIKEHVLKIHVDGRLKTELVCTPEYLPELVLGSLFCKGVITGASDVELLRIYDVGKSAQVLLDTHGKEKAQYIYTDAIEENSLRCPRRWIFNLCDLFERDMPIHEKTRSSHICYLMLNGTVVFQCEDIGRHNALDKAIGFALRNEHDLKQAIVYISGRMPTDMVRKVIKAGIPVLVSKAAPTKEAVELAKKYQLTLIGMAKGSQIKIYADNHGRICDHTVNHEA